MLSLSFSNTIEKVGVIDDRDGIYIVEVNKVHLDSFIVNPMTETQTLQASQRSSEEILVFLLSNGCSCIPHD